MKNYLLYSLLFVCSGIHAQSFFLTQSISNEQRFNSVLLPYNTNGQMVLDSILIEGGNDIEGTMIPNVSGDKITAYKITFSNGPYTNANMNILFNSKGLPESYLTILNNSNDQDTAKATIDYSSTGLQNGENINFTFSNPANKNFSKSYTLPFWASGENDIDSMQIDIMGDDNHHHNLTAFRFGQENKIKSFKSVYASDSAEYHYTINGLMWHIHYANGDEIEYYWSVANSIHENKTNDMKVYPNPFTSSFTLKNNFFSNVEMYNMLGEQVYTGKNSIVDATHLPAGTYLLKAFDTEGEQKVVLVTKQ